MMVSLQFLKRIEVFKGLSTDDLKAIADICSAKKFKEEDIVFSKDEEPEELYILKSGRCDVKISPGGKAETYTIYALNPGDIFGEVGFVDGSTRSATVKCVKESHVVALSRKKFAELCRGKNSHWSYSNEKPCYYFSKKAPRNR